MSIGLSENGGPFESSFLVYLPDDILAIISKFLRPKDLCNLSLSCRSLHSVAMVDKVWVIQCEKIGLVSPRYLTEWRKGVSSYKSLCRFLLGIRPLIGIWVHQNPELGNVVYIMYGFVSIVGCRIIPQELGPLGLHESPLLWAPVFEIFGDNDGSLVFFLHGRETDSDRLYPGCNVTVDQSCNVLLLEVGSNKGKELSKKIFRSDPAISRSQRTGVNVLSEVSFNRLAFGDRRRLLENFANKVRMKVPGNATGLLFPQSREDDLLNFQRDMIQLSERRSLLIQMIRTGVGRVDWQELPGLQMDYLVSDSNKTKKAVNRTITQEGSYFKENHSQNSKRRGVTGYLKDGLKNIIAKANSLNSNNGGSRNGSSSESRHSQLHEFLKPGEILGLCLRAAFTKLSTYHAWPSMHDTRFALYRLPLGVPTIDQEYAGLWGGTFGWPPGLPSKDKSGKALFFLLLSYEENEGQHFLIATKILEGTHYVLHPNGSAMFIVKVDEPSFDHFPWKTDGDSCPVEVKHVYNGEGIANGYGFRYPGSKPGSLFVIENGLLAFVWKESQAVLTLQRMDLSEFLRKGERVPALPPIANFAYLTKSYSNVFTGYATNHTVASSSLR